jgi:hypothetical protein
MASLTERIGTYGPGIMKKVIEACTSDNVDDFRAMLCRVKNLWYGYSSEPRVEASDQIRRGLFCENIEGRDAQESP